MKTYGENFVFGSDADGDTYYRASGALARLAKGAANLKMFMNAGATAPEWANGFKVVATTRDLAAADGTLAITGAGFKPSACIALIVVDDVAGKFSIGIDAGGTSRAVSSYHNVTAGAWVVSAQLGRIFNDAANYSTIAHSSYDADGSTISFTKTLSPTGTATSYIFYMR